MMANGDPLSLIQGMKGIAANLPLSRSLPVSDQVDSPRRKSVESRTEPVSYDSRSKPQAEPIRVDYTSTMGTATLGIDPMVSSASVIHELAYGRIDSVKSRTCGIAEYPVPRDSMSHSLDIIV